MNSLQSSAWRTFVAAVAVACLMLVPVAAQYPNSGKVGVPVKIWGSAFIPVSSGWFEASLEFEATFLPTTPSAGNAAYSGYGESVSDPPDDFEVEPQTVRLEPGKSYTVSITGENVDQAIFNAVAASGYDIEIDGIRRTTTDFTGSGGYISDFLILRVVPADGQTVPPVAGTGGEIGADRIYWEAALGSLKNGNSAGSLALIDTGTASWSTLYTPAALQYESPSTEVTVYRVGGVIRQILANAAIVDVEALSSTSYEVRFYNPSQVTNSTLPRTFSGNPFVKYEVQQVDSGTTPTKLQITKEARNLTTSGTVRTVTTIQRSSSWPSFSWTHRPWFTEGQTPLTEVVTTSNGFGSTRDETVSVQGYNGGTLAARIVRTFNPVVSGGHEVQTDETLGSSTGLDTDLEYYTNTSHPGSFGYLKSRVLPGGGWIAFDYYDATSGDTAHTGRVQRVYRPFKDTPSTVTLSATSGEVTYFEYAADPWGRNTRPSLVETQVDGELVSKSSTAYADLGNINGQPVVQATRKDFFSQSTSDYLSTVTKFYREDATDDFLRNQLYSTTRPDGVRTSYAYQRGSLSGSSFTAGSGSASRVVMIVGTSGGTYTAYDGHTIDALTLVSGKSTMQVILRDSRALVVRTETHAWNGSAWVAVAHVDYTYNAAGFLTERIANNGARYDAGYEGDRLVSETDESGVKVTYARDVAGRISTATKENGPVTTFAYDAAGRVLSETVSASGTSETIVSSRQFDTAGRLDNETPAGSGLIDHSYSVSARSHTITMPHGATRTETRHQDGRVEKITGNAQVEQYYGYSVETDGRRLTQVSAASSTSARWSKTWTDLLGRTTETQRPGFSQSSQAAFTTVNTYEATTGRLIKTTHSGHKPTRYEYDELGAVKRTGLDVGDNNGLDLNSMDRISETVTTFEFDTHVWRRTVKRTYPYDNSPADVVTSITRERLTGHPTNRLAEVQETDIEGNVATRTLDVNRSSKTLTASVSGPCNCSIASEVTTNGFPTSVTTRDGVTSTADYDALGRLHRERDPRHATGAGNLGYTVYAYKTGTGMVESVTDPAGNQVAFTSYDTSGRPSWQRNATNNYTRFAYNGRGQIIRQWGDAAYPVEYEYDNYGARTKTRTWRGSPVDFTHATEFQPSNYAYPASTGSVTTYVYDDPSGLLWKTLDHSGVGAEFDYNVRGQTTTRKWARTLTGSSTKLTTTYGYDAGTAELASVSYNDDAETIPTPDVTYGRNRAGLLTSVSDSAGSRSFIYDQPDRPWRLLSENLTGFFGSRQITRRYDATSGTGGTFGSHTIGTLKGRAAGFELGVAADTDRDLIQAYTHSNQHRFVGVTTTAGSGASLDVVYDYQSSSRFVHGYTAGTLAVVRTFETRRDLVASLETKWGSSSRALFEYTHDAVGRRRTARQSGTVFSDYYPPSGYNSVYQLFSYNSRGEVQSAALYRGDTPSLTPAATDLLPGRSFEYRYDSIGNRISSGFTGNTAAGDDEYVANDLNQYDSRENNRLMVSGTVSNTATVAVSGAIGNVTARRDRVWAAELAPANSSGPIKGTSTVTAALPGSTDVVRTENRDWLVPKALEPFGYDADGNLTTNGLWEFKWDAENRLVRMNSTLPTSSGFTRLRLDFKYDFAGRRIEKRVLNLDTSVETTARRFVYDGWNLIAELDGAGSAIVRSYTWGLDLADSLGETGGVGALLRITTYSSGSPSGSYFPAYDANGNITALLSASTGDPAAVYEYDPFGNPVRQEVIDSAVTDQPFRFSTKYTDAETGLVYYGYRYYEPRNGRFLGRDPLGESGGLNLYGFVSNDSVNGIDVLGMYEREGPPDENGCYVVEEVEVTDAGEKVVSSKRKCPDAYPSDPVPLPPFVVTERAYGGPKMIFGMTNYRFEVVHTVGPGMGVVSGGGGLELSLEERRQRCQALVARMIEFNQEWHDTWRHMLYPPAPEPPMSGKELLSKVRNRAEDNLAGLAADALNAMPGGNGIVLIAMMLQTQQAASDFAGGNPARSFMAGVTYGNATMQGFDRASRTTGVPLFSGATSRVLSRVGHLGVAYTVTDIVGLPALQYVDSRVRFQPDTRAMEWSRRNVFIPQLEAYNKLYNDLRCAEVLQ